MEKNIVNKSSSKSFNNFNVNNEHSDLDDNPPNLSIIWIATTMLTTTRDSVALTHKKLNFYLNKSKSTTQWLLKVLDTLEVLAEHLRDLSERKECIYDCRGGWEVYFYQLRRALNVMRKTVEKLPDIPPDESIDQRIARNWKKGAILEDIEYFHEDLMTLARVLPVMTLTSYESEKLKNEDILDIVKSGLFVSPFWYKYDDGLLKLKEAMNFMFSVVGKTYKREGIFKPFSLATSTLGTLWRNNTRLQQELCQKEANIELLKQLWHFEDDSTVGRLLNVVNKQLSKVSERIIVQRPNGGPIPVRIVSAVALPFKIPKELKTPVKKTTESTTVTKKGDQVEVSTVKTSRVISPEDDKPNKTALPLIGAAPLSNKSDKEVVVTDKEVAEKTHLTMSKDDSVKQHIHSENKSYSSSVTNGTSNGTGNANGQSPRLSSEKEGYKKHSRKSSGQSSSDSEDSKARIVYAKKLHDDPALGITVEKKLKKRSKSYEIFIENEFKDKQVWKERMKFTDRTDDLVKEEREKRERLEQLKREEEARRLQESRKPNFNSGNEPVPVPIILHFHGGGFVSGNAATHEVYLREWAKETSAIVFSVDYTLAPEAQYPLALEECYYIYRWLLEGNPLGIKPSKIILTGDSAGGNFALTVTLKAIREGIRKPDGLVLIYPAVDVSPTVTPSRVLYMNDIVIPYYFLMVCLQAYVPPDVNPRADPLISPLYASDDLLKQLPEKLTIISAGLDPLLDDTTRFRYRLEKVGKKYEYFLHKSLPHGFMNFAQLVSGAKKAVTDSCQVMVKMFGDEIKLKEKKLKNSKKKEEKTLHNSLIVPL